MTCEVRIDGAAVARVDAGDEDQEDELDADGTDGAGVLRL